jgi:hypothetical protein
MMKILDPLNLKQKAISMPQSIGGYNQINEENAKDFYGSGMNSHSQAYQTLLLAVKLFNIAVSQLRKFKIESMMNPNYEQAENADLKMREKCQNNFYKAIEVLNEQMLNNKRPNSGSKQRYYSGDFRVTHKSKSTSASHKESPLVESMDSIAGFSYFCIGILKKGIDSYAAKTSFDRSYQFFKKSNDMEMVEFAQRERYSSEYDNEESIEILDPSHLVFNSMF